MEQCVNVRVAEAEILDEKRILTAVAPDCAGGVEREKPRERQQRRPVAQAPYLQDGGQREHEAGRPQNGEDDRGAACQGVGSSVLGSVPPRLTPAATARASAASVRLAWLVHHSVEYRLSSIRNSFLATSEK